MSSSKVTVVLPEPDSTIPHEGEVGLLWDSVELLGGFIELWPVGINLPDGYFSPENISVDDVDRAGRVLLAVAAGMRTLKAWGGSDAD